MPNALYGLLFLPSVAGFVAQTRWTRQQQCIRPLAVAPLEVDTVTSTYDVILERPLGLTIETAGDMIVVVELKEGGSADVAGVEVGDALVGMMSFFGDAMWPAPK